MLMKLLLMLSIIMITGTFAASKPRKVKRLAQGTWGGMHIRIDVGPRTASVEWDCANGSITGPLNINSNGTFSWRGVHNREHPGPVRENDSGFQHPAVYSGTVKGDTMKLNVKLTDTNEVLDTFTLRRGSVGKVFKCK